MKMPYDQAIDKLLARAKVLCMRQAWTLYWEIRREIKTKLSGEPIGDYLRRSGQ